MTSEAVAGPILDDARLLTRHKDGYRVAKVTDWFGGFCKRAGATSAVLSVLIGNSSGSNSFGGAVVIIFAGVVLGLLFWIIGVFISAQGQLLKATLDTAVYSCTLLSETGKADIVL
jgi:hypothetical protein